MRFLLCLFLWALGLFSYNTYAQTSVGLHLSVKNGLGSNTVYDVIQGPDRHIWLATDAGVLRYDGIELQQFGYQQGLPEHDIFRLKVAPDSSIWFLGANGSISKWSVGTSSIEKHLDFERSFASDLLFLPNFMIASSHGAGISSLQNGKVGHSAVHENPKWRYVSQLWHASESNTCFALVSNSICTYDPTTNTLKQHTLLPEPAHVARACQLEDGRVLFNTKHRLFCFSENNPLQELLQCQPLVKKRINSLDVIDDQIFIGSDQGLILAEIRDDSICIRKKWLEHTRVSGILKDHEGGFWVSTLDEGVYRFSNLNAALLTSEPTYSLTLSNGELLLGHRSVTYSTVNKNGKRFQHQLVSPSNYLSEQVRAVFEQGERRFFQLNGSILLEEKGHFKRLTTGIAHLLFEDSLVHIGNQMGIWSLSRSTFEQEICQLQKPLVDLKAKHAKGFKVRDMCLYNGDVLLATNKGLKCWSPTQGLTEARFKGLAQGDVLDLELGQGCVYAATHGHGIFVLQGTDTTVINSKTGLSSDFMRSIKVTEDLIYCGGHGHLDLLTSSDLKRHSSLQFDADILDVETFQDRVYIATAKGCYTLNPQTIRAEQTVPALHLKKLTVQEEDVTRAYLTQLNYRNKRIHFQFHAVSFSSSEHVRYRYRLSPLDEDWHTAQNGNIALLSLQPGAYTLEVKASLGDKDSPVSTFALCIAPPFWQTWWFKSSVVLSLSALVYLFFRIRVLTYNRDVVRELLEALVKKIRREEVIVLKNTKDGSHTPVKLTQLLFVKGANNYLEIHVNASEPFLVRMTLNELEKQLATQKTPFLRCHKSYIVNLQNIQAVHGEFIKVKDKKIPIGKKFLPTISEKLSLLKKAG